MATVESLTSTINEMAAQTAKIKAEVDGKIADMQDQIDKLIAGEIPLEDVEAALNGLKTGLDEIDALIPDAEPPA